MMITKSRFHFKNFSFFALLILNLGIVTSSWAQETNSNWQFSVALGAGVRTNPVMDNKDIPLIVIPQLSYQGEHFFIQNLDFGYSFFQNDRQELSVLLTPSYDQVFFNEWDISNFVDHSSFANITKDGPTLEQNTRAIDKSKLHNRYMAGLAGIEYGQNIYDVDLQVQVLQEITGYYNGSEVRLALSKNISLGKSDVKLTFGTNWQSAASLNYFYGLKDFESMGQTSYSSSSGVSSLLRFDWSYHIDEHWSLRFFTSYRHLSHAISDSPLVTDNNVITAFAGGVYHF
jgi:MipA family protein